MHENVKIYYSRIIIVVFLGRRVFLFSQSAAVSLCETYREKERLYMCEWWPLFVVVVVVAVENALFAAAQLYVILNKVTFIWIVVETLEKFVENECERKLCVFVSNGSDGMGGGGSMNDVELSNKKNIQRCLRAMAAHCSDVN